MKIEQLEPRYLLTGTSWIVGQGLSQQAIREGQDIVRAIIPQVSNEVVISNANQVEDATTGSEADDIFSIENAKAGKTYSINGGGGYDIVALKEFLSRDVTLTAKKAVVSTTEGDFTIQFRNLERVSLADADFLIEFYDQMGRAGDFDVFVAEDMHAGDTDVEGKLAVGGNARFHDMGIGTRLDTASETTFVVGGDLTFERGSVAGKSFVGGQMGVSNALFQNYEFATQSSLINFDAAHKHLIDVSSTLKAKAPTHPTDVTPWGAISMVSDNDISVFEVTKSDLESATSWDINANLGSTVIVNISGEQIQVSNFQMSLNGAPLQSGSTAPFNVMLNFHDATTLSSSAFSWQGQLLAPHADMTFNNGHINGKLFVKSLSGGGEYHLVPMEPNLGLITTSTQTVFAIVNDAPSDDSESERLSAGLHQATNCYDIITLNNFSAQDAAFSGRLAVGGQADMDHVGVGTQAIAASNRDALVVGGNLTMNNAQSLGAVAVGGLASGVSDSEVRTDTPTDFDAMSQHLRRLSREMAVQETTNAPETTAWHAITINAANSSTETHVFEIPGVELQQAVSIDVMADEGDAVIVNVLGDEFTAGNFGIRINGKEVTLGMELDFDLVWNFPEANRLFTQHVAWVGTILAPTSHWDFRDANMHGRFITQSLTVTHAHFFGTCTHAQDGEAGTSTIPVTRVVSTPAPSGNSAPMVENDMYAVCFAENLSGDVGVNDLDQDEDLLSFSLSEQPRNGTVRLNLDGTFEYKPEFGFVGEVTFSYTASDGNGGEASGIVTTDVFDCSPPEVDLSVKKSITNVSAGVRLSGSVYSHDIAYPYDVIEYSVSVTNLSDHAASNVVLKDVIPENVDVWKSGDSLTHSSTGKRWDNNFWVGQLHSLDGFKGSPEFVDPSLGVVSIIEPHSASKGLTLSPGLDYGLLQGELTWTLGREIQPGKTITLKYYGMREVFSAYNWKYGTQFSTSAYIESLDQVDSDPSNNTADARSWWVSPVAIDLNRDHQIGVTGNDTAKGHVYSGGRLVNFDIDADGKLDRIEWFSGDGDGILVDTFRIGSHNRIDGRALFGDLGGTFHDGYQKLAQLDADHSQAIDGDELGRLALWVDDGDAILETGELQSLESHGIALISVIAELDLDGRLRSTAADSAGLQVMTEDVWFAHG